MARSACRWEPNARQSPQGDRRFFDKSRVERQPKEDLAAAVAVVRRGGFVCTSPWSSGTGRPRDNGDQLWTSASSGDAVSCAALARDSALRAVK
jgi:hypothetical protein